MAAGDVAPLTRWAKLMMMLQSAISVAAIALVIAARSTFSADRRKHNL
jgi:hypothetical protein